MQQLNVLYKWIDMRRSTLFNYLWDFIDDLRFTN